MPLGAGRVWLYRSLGIVAGTGIGLTAVLAILVVLDWRTLSDDVAAQRLLDLNWHDPNTRFDAELGWSPIPLRSLEKGWGRIETNSQGYRSAPLRVGAQAVVVLGDSVAWGYGVDGEQTFAARLDAGLRARSRSGGPSWQVHNLAVSGYGLDQSLLWFERQRQALPRVRYVVLAICSANDFADTTSNARYGRRKPLYRMRGDDLVLTGAPIRKHSLRHWYSNSRFLRAALARSGLIESWFLGRLGDHALDRSEGERVVRSLLARLEEETHARGGRLLVVLIPSRSDFPERSNAYRWFRDTLGTLGGAPLEAATLFESGAGPGATFLDQIHLTPAGHAAIARALLTRLTDPHSASAPLADGR